MPTRLNAIVMITILPHQGRQFDLQFFLLHILLHYLVNLMIVSAFVFKQLVERYSQVITLLLRGCFSLGLQYLKSSIFVSAPYELHRDDIFEGLRVNLGHIILLLLHQIYIKSRVYQSLQNILFSVIKDLSRLMQVFLIKILLLIIVIIMTSTCLLCYQDNQYFVLPPCNHKDICWKCCLKLVEGVIFTCPFCQSKPQIRSQLLFVSTDEMQTKEYQTIMKSNPFRSNKNSYYYYSNEDVAEYIEAETSFHCVHCGEVHQTINLLKKHLNNTHKLQFCDVCLDNRRCIITQQRLYSDGQLQVHLKQGDISQTGEVMLYHPGCEFCNRRFYDLQAFRLHLKTSSHYKCEICDINSTKLKYVYYKNYEQLERHHKKTHFVCDVGDCIAKKLQNVFASDALLEEHKRRCHKKYNKNGKEEKVENIIFGFNKNADQDQIEFDGIGKNLEKEFSIFERHEKVDKQSHQDELIDIREFYPEMTKNNLHIRVDDIINRLDQLTQAYGNRSKEVRFNDMLLFKPLEMSPLSRGQCERLLRRCFPPKQAEAIAEIFFTKRHEYMSFEAYFQAIEKRMKSTSNFAFYLVFPQLIRFMKDQNKNKAPMDEYYSLKLRLLTVKKDLMCHVFDRYSHFLKFLKRQVETQMIERFQNNLIDLDKYSKYLREMNINYYLDNQDNIYFVSKDKCTNLYHMIERSKTRDFLKMNWLLKVGLSQEKYQHIMKCIYFKTREECSQKIFKPFFIKDLSLIYLYLTICLQAINGQRTFQNSKKNPKAHYLTDFLSSVPKPATITNKQIDELRNLEGHSSAIEKKTRQRTGRMVIVDQGDCPTLLKVEIQPNPARRKPPDEPELGIGKARLPVWNEDEAVRRKKQTLKPDESKHDDQFPSISTPRKMNGKKGGSNKKEEEEDFPLLVYNFDKKFVAPRAKKEETSMKIQEFVGFNSRTVTREWNQNNTRAKFDQLQKEKEEELRARELQRAKEEQLAKQQRQKKKQTKKPAKSTKLPSDDDEDEQLRMAIRQSMKTAVEEENHRNENSRNFKALEIIVPKKKEEEEVHVPKKYKKKSKPVEEKKEESKVEEFLFEQIEKQAEIQMKKEKVRKPIMRVDYSGSEDQAPKIETKTQPKVEKTQPKTKQTKEPINNNEEEFSSLVSQGGLSVVNRLQQQASSGDVQKNQKKVKKGKNGKSIVIQSFKLF